MAVCYECNAIKHDHEFDSIYHIRMFIHELKRWCKINKENPINASQNRSGKSPSCLIAWKKASYMSYSHEQHLKDNPPVEQASTLTVGCATASQSENEIVRASVRPCIEKIEAAKKLLDKFLR